MFLIDILLEQHHQHGQDQDADVEEHRPDLGVVDVMADARLHLVQRLGLAAEAVDLRPAGDAGLDLVADHVALDQLAIHLIVGDGVWAWPDNAHAPLQDIDELR